MSATQFSKPFLVFSEYTPSMAIVEFAGTALLVTCLKARRRGGRFYKASAGEFRFATATVFQSKQGLICCPSQGTAWCSVCSTDATGLPRAESCVAGVAACAACCVWPLCFPELNSFRSPGREDDTVRQRSSSAGQGQEAFFSSQVGKWYVLPGFL